MKNVFFVWTNYQARVEGLSNDLKARLGSVDIIYRRNPQTSKFKKIFIYIYYIFKDFLYLNKKKPDNFFVQLPPTFALIAPLAYRLFTKRSVNIIADCHNALLRKPWVNQIGTKKLIQYTNICLLHNENIYQQSLEFFSFVSKQKLLILEDKTLEFSFNEAMNNKSRNNSPCIFFPASFNKDEPVIEFIETANQMKECTFITTGNIEKLQKNFGRLPSSLPNNLQVTGWVSKETYLSYMQRADILLCLTLYDNIQMSASNEGLSFNKVMVVSDTKTLRGLYGNAAIYTSNKGSSIKIAIQKAIEEHNNLLNELKKVKLRKQKRYCEQLDLLINSIQKSTK
ncbi:MAG: hypothetical protein ABF969_10540 [Sporolactobacillus sp.]